jgi:hypothetical protein
MENLRKRTKQKCKTKWKANPAEQNKQKTISELENEMVIKGKNKELLVNNSRPVKRKCKNSLNLSKDKPQESWALKKEKRCKQRECIIYSTK